MTQLAAAAGVWIRRLRAAGRLVLCLAFVLAPLAAHAAPTHETRACVSAEAADSGCSGSEAPAEEAACCNALAPCQVMMAPPLPTLGPDRVASAVRHVLAIMPASAIMSPLFRPPRTAVPA